MSSPSPKPRGRFSLRITILTMMLFVLAALAAGLLALGHWASRDVLVTAARDHMATVESLVVERLETTFGQARIHVPLLASLPVLREAPRSDSHPAEPLLRTLMESTPGFHHLFVHYPDGTFLRLIDMEDATPAERTALRAPPKTQRVVQIRFRDRDGFHWTLWRYEDRKGATIDALLEEGVKEGGAPPAWTEGVLAAKGPVELGPRRAAPSGQPVLTLAAPLTDTPGAVVGVDIALTRLSAFLADHKPTPRSRLVMLDRRGAITASQDGATLDRLWGEGAANDPVPQVRLAQLNDPVLEALRSHLLEADHAREVDLSLEDEAWIARLMPLAQGIGGERWILLATPIPEVVGPLLPVLRLGGWYTLAVILGAIPLVILAAALVATPLRRLTRAAEAFRALDLATPLGVRSRITEVDRLATTLESMRAGVETFTHYVPRTLVERAIASGRGAERGGDRREATLLFSDVEGFTSLADGRDPERTMADASAYFEVLGQAIQAGGGVIDKFIGDGVMAFWNAPEANPNHARDACRCVREARRMVTAWNMRRVHRGQPPFPTRFGLHTGPVVVGNLGTHDRLNYTAVGATVNLASRLEGLNKVYGSSILVGDATRRAAEAGDPSLLFRTVDLVVPKGARAALEVHDLIDPEGEAMGGDDLRAYLRDWEAAVVLYRDGNGAEALAAFHDLAHRRPRDRVADLYLARLATWGADRPPRGWSATFHATDK
jgi:adenylate cyclase